MLKLRLMPETFMLQLMHVVILALIQPARSTTMSLGIT